jgi:uncharacterized membrane protein
MEPSDASDTRPVPLQWVARIEDDERLDALAARLGELTAPLGRGPLGGALRGEWLGHALHPLLTDLPLGCWLSSGLLDLVGGTAGRRASRRLVGLGLMAAVPTMAAGYAELSTIDEPHRRRVAAVHASGNGVVGFCYLRSWQARHRGHHAAGVMWGMAGGALAWVTGYLGGHLSLARAVGTGERVFGESGGTTGQHNGQHDPGALIDLVTAADRLHLPVERVHAMVAEGVLTPAVEGERLQFTEAEVAAVRLLGA